MKRLCFPIFSGLWRATTLILGVGILGFAPPARAKSPLEIARGKQLFERQWTSQNPILGQDGLGPMFNANACSTCHHQGGLGGGGDTRFNAKSIGIESIHVDGFGSRLDLAGLVRTLHPGLASPDGNVLSSVAVPHFGGAVGTENLRAFLRSNVPVRHVSEGGVATSSDVRQLDSHRFEWTAERQNLKIKLELRLFARNTTPLFGLGLIDRIPADAIIANAKRQLADRDVSGRLAVNPQGEVARFGWRANRVQLIGFVGQACAAEMGLQTARFDQPGDPNVRDYRNPGKDISESDVQAMTAFIAALPRPVQALGSHDPAVLAHGRQVFASIGCASCHTPDLGGVEDLFSDLLLHDMGPHLYDYDNPYPKVKKSRIEARYQVVSQRVMSSGYYGQPTTIRTGSQPSTARVRFRNRKIVTPRSSPDSQVVVLGQPERLIVNSQGQTRHAAETMEVGDRTLQQQHVLKRTIEPTAVAQEWRTPPLWGVADSAPYMHDGRAETLLEAIAMHAGEGQASRRRFLQSSTTDRQALLAFLESLRAPR
ncbi:MAG: di-heme oxidoredictase family protein [Planctomycetota bacterium]